MNGKNKNINVVNTERHIQNFKCSFCSKKFTNTDKLQMHEQNEHSNEFHAAMVREMYGYEDGYDFFDEFQEKNKTK